MKRLLLLTPALMIATADVSLADLPTHARSVEQHRQQAASLSSNSLVVEASAKTTTRHGQKRVQPIPPPNADPDKEPLLVALCSYCHPRPAVDRWQQFRQVLWAVFRG
jgi:hypothetical protein